MYISLSDFSPFASLIILKDSRSPPCCYEFAGRAIRHGNRERQTKRFQKRSIIPAPIPLTRTCISHNSLTQDNTTHTANISSYREHTWFWIILHISVLKDPNKENPVKVCYYTTQAWHKQPFYDSFSGVQDHKQLTRCSCVVLAQSLLKQFHKSVGKEYFYMIHTIHCIFCSEVIINSLFIYFCEGKYIRL